MREIAREEIMGKSLSNLTRVLMVNLCTKKANLRKGRNSSKEALATRTQML